jgi:phosphotriesterase-related protein
MHTEKGEGLEEILAFFDKQGLEPERLVIAHIDKRPDLSLHQELARAGYLLEYDTFFREKYEPEKNLWPLLLEMVEAGFSDSIALATDQADPGMWEVFGTGPGLPGFIRVIKKRLDEEIKDAETVNGLVGRNISRRLAVI